MRSDFKSRNTGNINISGTGSTAHTFGNVIPHRYHRWFRNQRDAFTSAVVSITTGKCFDVAVFPALSSTVTQQLLALNLPGMALLQNANQPQTQSRYNHDHQSPSPPRL
ncbi:hypothetical protein KCP78_21670 [Salmonella enterica subsp. enterica]|nr:hypothetical protein KCP78_21670 [Salmonella enterica subsp. enterica]